MSTIIELKNLFKTFKLPHRRQVEVLKDVNLEIKEGEFVLVYGPSGCGKTTLLNLILGLETPTEGKVVVKDRNLAHMTTRKRSLFRLKNFGPVYQNQIWLKSLNVVENVALPLYLAGRDKRTAIAHALGCLEIPGMTRFAKSRPNELSAGEQQRIGLARALAVDAPIIVADEPTGNIDSRASDEMMSVFDTLNRRFKKTIVLVTHNQAYWTIGTRQVELLDGKIIKNNESGSKK